MNLTHLKYMVEVERHGSITKAAAALYMGQPNLSKAIKELELEFGVPIFKRSAKGVVPTEKGKELLLHAKAILSQVEKMEQLSREDDRSSLEFSLLLPRASYISHAFTLFLNEVDAVEKMNIKFKETNSMSAIDLVADCEYNLGIIRYPVNYEAFFLSAIEEKGLKAREVWTYDYVLLMSAKSPLARAPEIRASVLDDYIEILHGDNIVPNISQTFLKRTPSWGQAGGTSLYMSGAASSIYCAPFQTPICGYRLCRGRCCDATGWCRSPVPTLSSAIETCLSIRATTVFRRRRSCSLTP